MTKPKSNENEAENLKQKMLSFRQEEDKRALSQQHELMQPKPSNRCVKLNPKKESIDLYALWLEKYKKKHPDFNDKENTYNVDKNGSGWINFNDPKAEEDFVRDLATQGFNGSIFSGNQCIAQIKNGMLIDPRTKKEFVEGDYEVMVTKLNSGIAYDDIPLHHPKPNSRTAI